MPVPFVCVYVIRFPFIIQSYNFSHPFLCRVFRRRYIDSIQSKPNSLFVRVSNYKKFSSCVFIAAFGPRGQLS